MTRPWRRQILAVAVAGALLLGACSGRTSVAPVPGATASSTSSARSSTAPAPTSLPGTARATPRTVQRAPSPAPRVPPATLRDDNTLYLGTYDGLPALFFTDKRRQEYVEFGEARKTNPYIGELLQLGRAGIYPGHLHPFDYRDLVQPRKITFRPAQPVVRIVSFRLNATGDRLYVSVDVERGTADLYPNNSINAVVRIDLDSGASEELWSNVVGSDSYPGARGAAYLDQIVEDTYVTLVLMSCAGCESVPAGAIVLNTGTKQTVYRAGVGDLRLDPRSNTFSYRKLIVPVREPCPQRPGCDSDGTRTIFEPGGPAITDQLP